MAQPKPAASSPQLPAAAAQFRWIVGLLGLLALGGVLPWVRWQPWPGLVLLFAASIVADLLLQVQIDRRRFISLASTFTFITFLSYGSATATMLSTAALLASLLWKRVTGQARPSVRFVWFNVGQIAVGLVGAAVITLLLARTPPHAPPQTWLWPLIVYVLACLGLNIALTSIATALLGGRAEVRQRLWPQVSRWAALSFALSAPLALTTEALATQVGLAPAVAVLSCALGVIAYILRLATRLSQANRELRVLNTSGAELAATLELGVLFPAIHRSVKQLMAVDAFGIALVDTEQHEIDVAYLVDNGVELAPRRLPWGTGLMGQVLATRMPLVINNLEQQVPSPVFFGRTDRPIRSVLLVPLRAGEHVIGVLSTQSYATDAFAQRERELLQAIAQIAGIAIHNAQLYARERRLLREREEFVSLIAHELRNPITTIQGYQQIITRRVRTSEPTVQRPLEIIREQTTRMSRLINDLLDLSRADLGQLRINHAPVNVEQLVEAVLEQVQMIAPERPWTWQRCGTLAMIDGDAQRIEQVLQNVLSNAVKYSPDGGAITVTTSPRAGDDRAWPTSVQARVKGRQWVLVTVRDTGVGIPPEQLPHIFTRFYRAANNRDGTIAGVGLGLSVCAELVRAHNGLLWADSTLSQGTTMHIALPAVGGAAQEANNSAQAEQSAIG